jgi:hypothetical protein
VAEGGGLLNRYRVVKPYRGFESLRLRHPLADFLSRELFGPLCAMIRLAISNAIIRITSRIRFKLGR